MSITALLPLNAEMHMFSYRPPSWHVGKERETKLHGKIGRGQSDITHGIPAAGNGESAHTPDTALPPITYHLIGDCDWEHPRRCTGGVRPASAHPHVLLPWQSLLLGDLLQLHHPAPADGQLPHWGQDHLCLWLYGGILLLCFLCSYWVLPAWQPCPTIGTWPYTSHRSVPAS